MTDEELGAIIESQERAAQVFAHTDLASERAKSMDYYLGKPFGNEVEGRSQVVSTDVFDTVEGMLPSLMEIFTGSNRLCECNATGPEDEPEARQQTAAANHVLTKMNDPALYLYTWMKDALLQKVGVVKTYYDEQNEYRTARYRGLTDEEMALVADDDAVEVVENVEYQTEMPGPDGEAVSIRLHDVTLRVATKRQVIKVVNIPPENFLVTTRQRSLDLADCEFCSHRERKTVTDLREMGVPQEFLDEIGEEDSAMEYTEERISRDLYANTLGDVQHEQKATREIWCSDVYMVVDTNDDGVAEYRRIVKIGRKVWTNEEVDTNPFSVICPIPLPHQFYGLSEADITADVQLNKSVIWRQMLDNLYFSNNPMNMVLEDQVNLDDLLTSRPAGIVRMKMPGAVTPYAVPFVAKESFPMMEYWDGVKENRTGVTRYNQGTDADSLNKTARGISQIMAAGARRLEMVARLFAVGIKDLVRKVLHCMATNGMKPFVVQLTNGYVPIDPRAWTKQFNITIAVALGTGNKDRQIQMLGMIGGKLLELKQTGRGYMVSEENDYNHAVKLIEACGFANAEMFVTDPRIVPPQAKQAPPPIEVLKLEQDGKLKLLDMRVTSEQKNKDMSNDRAIEEMKARIAAAADVEVARIQAAAAAQVAGIRSETDRRLKAADATIGEEKLRHDERVKVFEAAEDRARPVEAAKAAGDQMKATLEEAMRALAQALAQTNEQVAQLARTTDEVLRYQRAPRKKVKDKNGRLVGVEVEGFGTVQVQ